MTDGRDDYEELLSEKRFLNEIEQGIRAANTKIIHERIPTLSKETIHAFAVAVGRLRARYLEAAFKLGVNEQGDPPKDAVVTELRLRREMFEEARAAFEALRDAILKGYVDVEGLSRKP